MDNNSKQTAQQTQSEIPQFNVPQIPLQLPPEQTMQQSAESEAPKKKKNWKIWLIVIAVIVIAAGLGYYFLSS